MQRTNNQNVSNQILNISVGTLPQVVQSGTLQTKNQLHKITHLQNNVCSTMCSAIGAFIVRIYNAVINFFMTICCCAKRAQNNNNNQTTVGVNPPQIINPPPRPPVINPPQRPPGGGYIPPINPRPPGGGYIPPVHGAGNNPPAPPIGGNQLINEPNPIPYRRSEDVELFQLDNEYPNEYPNICNHMVGRSHRALNTLGERKLAQIEQLLGGIHDGDIDPDLMKEYERIRDRYLVNDRDPVEMRDQIAIQNEIPHMIFDRRGLSQRPAAITQANNDPAIDNIDIDDLMACFDEAYAHEPRNAAGYADPAVQTMRDRIQRYTNFIMGRLQNDQHHFAEYTRLIQKSARILINEMRKPPTNNAAVDQAYKAQIQVTFVNLASVMEDLENHDGGCHPRRFNEIDKRIRYLQGTALGAPIPNMGENSYKLFYTLAMFNTEDKENIILSLLQDGGQFHVISPARTEIGDEWGLHYHPVRDEYHNVGGQPAAVYREILDDQYTPQVLMKNTLVRFTNPENLYFKDLIPRVLNEIIERLPAAQREYAVYQLNNPGAPDSFYDAARQGVYENQPRPNARMVRFILQNLRFMMRDPVAPAEAARVIPVQFREGANAGPQQPVVNVRRGLNPEELRVIANRRELTPVELQDIAELNLEDTNGQIAALRRSVDHARGQLGLDGNNAPRQLNPEEILPNLADVPRNRFIGTLAAEVARRNALQARLPQLEAGRISVPRALLAHIAQLNPQNIEQFINDREAIVGPIQERLRAAQGDARGPMQLELDTEYAILVAARARQTELNQANDAE